MVPSFRLMLCVSAAALLLSACDRNLEPYDPDEEPRQPDLSRIFPAGAERAAQADAPGAGVPGAMAPVAPGGRGAPPVTANAPPIRGSVSVAPDLGASVPEGAVLFVIARPEGGAGPPLAVKRIASPRFPVAFEIGPDDRMIQQMPFTGPLQLSARLDGDANATTRLAGDLFGRAPGTVDPGASDVRIVLDEVSGS